MPWHARHGPSQHIPPGAQPRHIPNRRDGRQALTGARAPHDDGHIRGIGHLEAVTGKKQKKNEKYKKDVHVEIFLWIHLRNKGQVVQVDL